MGAPGATASGVTMGLESGWNMADVDIATHRAQSTPEARADGAATEPLLSHIPGLPRNWRCKSASSSPEPVVCSTSPSEHHFAIRSEPSAPVTDGLSSMRDRVCMAMDQLQMNTQFTAEAALKQASSTSLVTQLLAALSGELEAITAERDELLQHASTREVSPLHHAQWQSVRPSGYQLCMYRHCQRG